MKKKPAARSAAALLTAALLTAVLMLPAGQMHVRAQTPGAESLCLKVVLKEGEELVSGITIAIYSAAVSDTGDASEETKSAVLYEELSARESAAAAAALAEELQSGGSAVRSETTDADGEAVFADLEAGIWLVFQESQEAVFEPFFVSVTEGAASAGGQGTAVVTASPKVKTSAAETVSEAVRVSSVKTGDTSGIGRYVFLLCAAAAAGVTVRVYRERRMRRVPEKFTGR